MLSHLVYNFSMARGWESKSVEQQIEDAPTYNSTVGPVAPDDIELRQKQEGLRLQRSRILQEIEAAHNPRYRDLLKEMLHHLDNLLSQ
jgi:hypothetical protein